MTTDRDVRAHISELVAEEHSLRTRHEAGTIDGDVERARLAAVEVELDQCWDLLRQREALRGSGQDPAGAALRSGDQVEGYLG